MEFLKTDAHQEKERRLKRDITEPFGPALVPQ
jgi:hypothetical protein